MKKPLFLFLIIPVIFLAFVGFSEAQIQNPIAVGSVKDLITKLIGALRNIVAILAPIAFIVASILYATSTGNPERINKAKDFLIYAIIGVIIVLTAQAVITTLETIFR